MKISVVTVSYNCENSIAKTIESVMSQDYSDLEYLIIDGGSPDKTAQVADSYSEKMSDRGIEYRVLSEPDNGIYDGMNKGARLATGDIIAFLNCGDTYEPHALENVSAQFDLSECDIVLGNLKIIKTNGSSFIKKSRVRKYQTSRDWNHPAMFVRTELMKDNPFACLGIHDDYGFYLKMVKQGRRIKPIDMVLADFYMGGISNKKSLKMARKRIYDRYKYCYKINGFSSWYFIECFFMEAVKFLVG